MAALAASASDRAGWPRLVRYRQSGARRKVSAGGLKVQLCLD